MQRIDGRAENQLRTVKFVRNFIPIAEGSVLIEVGATRVICTATVEEKVPPFLRGEGKGWVTAEYSMLPRATQARTVREVNRGHASGRTQEIQRLIGRAMRSVVRLKELGERTIWLDCDVIQADGGTRTASITGAFVAMVDAMHSLVQKGLLAKIPVSDMLAAVSVGKVEGDIILDLCYHEDSKAEVDMNVIMTGQGHYVEIQGTAEAAPFAGQELTEMLDFARAGISQLVAIQRQALGPLADQIGAIQ